MLSYTEFAMMTRFVEGYYSESNVPSTGLGQYTERIKWRCKSKTGQDNEGLQREN